MCHPNEVCNKTWEKVGTTSLEMLTPTSTTPMTSTFNSNKLFLLAYDVHVNKKPGRKRQWKLPDKYPYWFVLFQLPLEQASHHRRDQQEQQRKVLTCDKKRKDSQPAASKIRVISIYLFATVKDI